MEDIIRRCCICKGTVKEPTPGCYYSDGILSRDCFEKKFGHDDVTFSLVNKINFQLETCEGLYHKGDKNGSE